MYTDTPGWTHRHSLPLDGPHSSIHLVQILLVKVEFIFDNVVSVTFKIKSLSAEGSVTVSNNTPLQFVIIVNVMIP